MKKNLLSILILALLVVNIVISIISMVSVSGASKKTAALVADIATIIDLEIDGVQKTNVGSNTVAMSDSAQYNFTEQMTISLQKGEDGSDHYALLKVTLAMDTQNPDYATYSETMADREGLMKGVIFEVVGARTAEQARTQQEQEAMRQEILTKLQEMFDSDFIYNVVFSEIMVQ